MSIVQPVLAIEIGNSRIKFGIFRHATSEVPGQLPVCDERIAVPVADETFPWSDLQSALGDVLPKSVIASVNPPVLQRLLANWPRSSWPEPRVLTTNSELTVANQTQFPDRVGTDRLLKAVAGNVMRSEGQPLILVDSGTATTVDWVTSDGVFAGGAILPGLRLSSQVLHDRTAQLPLIAPETFQHAAPAAIGTETQSALQSGIYWGHVGAVRELIQRMSAEHSGLPPAIFITGGGGEILARELGLPASYYRDLTLQGLAVTGNLGGEAPAEPLSLPGTET